MPMPEPLRERGLIVSAATPDSPRPQPRTEWRRDPLVDRWVIFSTARNDRPQPLCPQETGLEEVPPSAEENPFLAGQEQETPSELWAIREPDSKPDDPRWHVRAVPNRYPAVTPRSPESMHAVRRFFQELHAAAETQPADSEHDRIHKACDGVGHHELIVESPYYESRLGRLPAKQIERVLLTWQQRLRALRSSPGIAHAMLFKNVGAAAGASLPHGHSQIIGLPMLTPIVREQLVQVREQRRLNAECLFCRILQRERSLRERVVCEGERFTVLAPFASRFPYEMTIYPRQCSGEFDRLESPATRELARLLKRLLLALDQVAGRPAWNLVLHVAPFHLAEAVPFHWQLEILPRIGGLAGFELGTGWAMNPLFPESAAVQLRAALAEQE